MFLRINQSIIRNILIGRLLTMLEKVVLSRSQIFSISGVSHLLINNFGASATWDLKLGELILAIDYESSFNINRQICMITHRVQKIRRKVIFYGYKYRTVARKIKQKNWILPFLVHCLCWRISNLSKSIRLNFSNYRNLWRSGSNFLFKPLYFV